MKPELPFILVFALKGLIHEFGDDSLLHHVSRTSPILGSAPGEPLSFKRKTFEEEDQPRVAGRVSDFVELYQATSTIKKGGYEGPERANPGQDGGKEVKKGANHSFKGPPI
jgi:hypothetical protein